MPVGPAEHRVAIVPEQDGERAVVRVLRRGYVEACEAVADDGGVLGARLGFGGDAEVSHDLFRLALTASHILPQSGFAGADDGFCPVRHL